MTASTDLPTLIGERIRAYRKEAGLSLAALSKICGVSISMLSKIEQAKTQPPVSTYANIARGLEVSLSQLFAEEGLRSRLSILRKEERETLTRGMYVAYPLSRPVDDKRMEPFLFEAPPSKTYHRPLSHPGQEMLFVLSGTLAFRYGESQYTLNPGDCAYYWADVPHTSRALSDAGVTMLVIQTSGPSR